MRPAFAFHSRSSPVPCTPGGTASRRGILVLFAPTISRWSHIALEDELARFTGTEHYYEHFTGFHYTEGIKYLADRLRCHWLIDLVGSYQPQLRNVPFQLWQIHVSQDQSALVTMAEDSGAPTLVSQQIRYTDFALPEFSFYCVERVVMLKSEY
jgi:hypothetical protein